MPIDVEAALSAAPTVRTVTWTTRDVLLYHLSLGAGRGPAPDPELGWTYERDLQVLPTFAMVAGRGLSAGDHAGGSAMVMPGIDVDLRQVLHGGQALRLHRPIPVCGAAEVLTRVRQVWDKGRAAVVVLESQAVGQDGDPMWTTAMQIWVRGEGGFGGDPGPGREHHRPDRVPDHVLESLTTADQARLYRLNGDMNPLHVDPEFARQAGFERPILHGLASYGIVARTLVDDLLDGDASRLRGWEVRFAGPVTPGETLRTSVWRVGEELVAETTCPDRGDAPVLSHAVAQVRPG